jgi:hypothetical protein
MGSFTGNTPTLLTSSLGSSMCYGHRTLQPYLEVTRRHSQCVNYSWTERIRDAVGSVGQQRGCEGESDLTNAGIVGGWSYPPSKKS